MHLPHPNKVLSVAPSLLGRSTRGRIRTVIITFVLFAVFGLAYTWPTSDGTAATPRVATAGQAAVQTAVQAAVHAADQPASSSTGASANGSSVAGSPVTGSDAGPTAAGPSITPPGPMPARAVHAAPATVVQAAHPTQGASVAVESKTPTGYGCGAALAYLRANAAPGFIFECPGYADGHQAMTCINHAPECGGEKLIAIAVPCAAAYMNEAHNSWVLSGLRSGSIDPYGYCH